MGTEAHILLLFLPAIFVPVIFAVVWGPRAPVEGQDGRWKVYFRESTRAGAWGIAIDIPYGVCVAAFGGLTGGIMSEGTVLGVPFAVLFGSIIIGIGLGGGLLLWFVAYWLS